MVIPGAIRKVGKVGYIHTVHISRQFVTMMENAVQCTWGGPLSLVGVACWCDCSASKPASGVLPCGGPWREAGLGVTFEGGRRCYRG